MFRLPRLENRCDILALCLLLIALQQLGSATMIKAKAWLAPLLIEQAWQETLLRDGAAVKPWPWADTWPVARLRAPAQGVDLLVLAGDSGNALAFGPGHAGASAPLGSDGMAVIGGHRDTHFAFLRQLHDGEVLQLQLPDGQQRRYRVAARRVVDADRESLSSTAVGETLLLVTCYPFNSLRAGGPLRYAVRAVPALTPLPAGGPLAGDAGIYDL
ncbi:MAG: class GN sortase [Gammaproteobacteria bacterium]|nr:class GN sortase [Gammaproteobacteria bacterium]